MTQEEPYGGKVVKVDPEKPRGRADPPGAAALIATDVYETTKIGENHRKIVCFAVGQH